jgi:dihydroorotate dehydrogenase (fumarate)
MNTQIEEWMERKEFRSVDEFRGRLNYRNYGRPVVYERTQFMKYFAAED